MRLVTTEDLAALESWGMSRETLQAVRWVGIDSYHRVHHLQEANEHCVTNGHESLLRNVELSAMDLLGQTVCACLIDRSYQDDMHWYNLFMLLQVTKEAGATEEDLTAQELTDLCRTLESQILTLASDLAELNDCHPDPSGSATAGEQALRALTARRRAAMDRLQSPEMRRSLPVSDPEDTSRFLLALQGFSFYHSRRDMQAASILLAYEYQSDMENDTLLAIVPGRHRTRVLAWAQDLQEEHMTASLQYYDRYYVVELSEEDTPEVCEIASALWTPHEEKPTSDPGHAFALARSLTTQSPK